jgi:putative hydrolase of the HAD superfamily
MSVRKLAAVVFDLDDTLYPEREYVLSGFHAVAQWVEINLAIPAEQGFAELKTLFDEGVRGDTFNRWLETHHYTDDGIAPIIAVYREHTPILTPFPDAVPLLESLYPDYKIGLVSDGYLNVQKLKWAALGLEKWFKAVVFSDEWGRAAWKPNRKPFDEVLRQLNVDAAKSVYIADNPRKDFLGARNAGMKSIRVRRAGGEYSHLEPESPEHAADATVETFAEIKEALLISILNI